MPGILYVVATPIGNLEDLTPRARRVLGEVALVAAEDTRRTAKLLAHCGLRTPMVSLREHNEARESPRLVARLQGGDSIALVSDAGTPGIADPGARLVRAALDAGQRVVPVPGPSAITAALSASGFDGSSFVFLGFPPPKGRARLAWLDSLRSEDRVIVAFEAPHRIRRTLEDIKAVVKRPIIVFRELTKIHEELAITPNTSHIEPIGEFVIVMGPSGERTDQTTETLHEAVMLASHLIDLGLDRDRAADLAACKYKLVVKAVANALKKHIILVKQQRQLVP